MSKSGDYVYKAYDILFQTIINAEDAIENQIDDEFRYQCLYCKKEVYLAAKDSIYKSAHFRHKTGDNDIVKCDEYVDSNQYQKHFNNVDLYFDVYFSSRKKLFLASVKITDDKIEEYKSKGLKLSIISDKKENAITELPINEMHFSNEVRNEIPINLYSNVYYPKIGNEIYGTPQMIFSKHYPTVFKILGKDETDFTSKLVKSRVLYTKNKYFFVYNSNFDLEWIKENANIKIINQFEFDTMRKHFKGVVIIIDKKNQEIEKILKKYGYYIETAETLSVLWPPACDNTGVLNIGSNDVYLSSSFELIEHRNTNSNNLNKVDIGKDISKIHIEGLLKIESRNIKETIQVTDNFSDRTPLFPEIQKQDLFTASHKNFFIIDADGIKNMDVGEKAYLIAGTYIIEVDRNNYILRYIYPRTEDEISVEMILQDILKHYWVEVEYGKLKDSENQTVLNYQNKCKQKGKINKCVRHYIEKGIL